MIFSRALLSPARRAAKVSISSRALSGFGKLPASRCSASTRNFVAKNCSSVNSIHSTPWCYCMLLEDHKVFLRNPERRDVILQFLCGLARIKNKEPNFVGKTEEPL